MTYTIYLTTFRRQPDGTMNLDNRTSKRVKDPDSWLDKQERAHGWDIAVSRVQGWPIVSFSGRAGDTFVAGYYVPSKEG